MHDFAMMGAMGVAAFLVFGIIATAIFALWLWALVDILKNEFTGSNKIIWLLLVIAVPLIGVILYYLIGREQKISDK
ncbi:PLD nuclease N-terminal domain-containing protein [Geotalea uraniireducens]|uniref:Cardiolipin synthase N-terminal domain-containing protein n=1 Tax=Geotalea uraniireducens (strain Rf4) TaxID=351605 RepID=A5G6N5_GEOUR|nr:PLD nuclease N-terminal domain-containing protein [Geotalea uraniireducens]ABQ27453.1 hypothetical protein Gura_3296 [Geotalea uraniireducens Rf4]